MECLGNVSKATDCLITLLSNKPFATDKLTKAAYSQLIQLFVSTPKWYTCPKIQHTLVILLRMTICQKIATPESDKAAALISVILDAMSIKEEAKPFNIFDSLDTVIALAGGKEKFERLCVDCLLSLVRMFTKCSSTTGAPEAKTAATEPDIVPVELREEMLKKADWVLPKYSESEKKTVDDKASSFTDKIINNVFSTMLGDIAEKIAPLKSLQEIIPDITKAESVKESDTKKDSSVDFDKFCRELAEKLKNSKKDPSV